MTFRVTIIVSTINYLILQANDIDVYFANPVRCFKPTDPALFH